MITAKIKKRKGASDINKLLKKFRSLNQKIQLGYFSDSGIHSEAGVPYSTLMAWHEYGLGNYPARPLMSLASIKIEQSLKNGDYKDIIKKAIVSNQKDPLTEIAKRIVNDVQNMFGDNSILTNNSPYVVNYKGANTPLLETGELRSKFTFKIGANK